MEGGNSIADLLTGKVNPSGKLTMTWPIAATDHASTKNFPGNIDFYSFKEMAASKRPISGHTYTNHEEDIYVGYRFFDTFNREVAYPFGYGLSYTTFEFSKPTVKAKGKDAVELSVTIKNSGAVSGKEVAQVYVQAPKGKLEKPAQELKAFAKTRELKPGESQTLQMTIPVRDLASFDEAGSQWVTEAGTYTFRIGSSSRDIKCTASLRLTDYTEKTTNALAPQHPLNLLKQ
jgi:beta-glucosidase